MVHRSRVLSAIALALLIVFGALALAARDAGQAEARAISTGFPQPVQNAEKLRLGVNAALEQYDEATLEQRLSDLAAAGVTDIRQEFRWSDIEPAKGAPDWRAADRIVAAARRHHVQVLAVLWTTPAWARGSSGSAAFPAIETAPPADPADFAAFAGAFAARYATPNCDALRTGCAILAYQIWDEPNLSAAWGNALINPADYLRLLKAARIAIRSADPQAILVLGALAPTAEQSQVNLAPQAYLRRLYELGGHDAFDVVAAKPYGFNFPPADRRVDPGVLNFSHALLLRREMELHNEANKSIWITQFGWNALPGDWAGAKSVWSGVTGEQQVEYTRDALARAAAEWPWLGGMYIENLQPRPSAQGAADPRWGFALLNPDGAARPLWAAWKTAISDVRSGRLPSPRAQWFALPPNSRPKDEAGVAGFQANPNATFSPGWRFGELGADAPDRSDARIEARFTGDDLALIVKRGEYRFRAYLYVTVDGRPANLLPRDPGGPNQGAYLTMTSARNVPWIETIPVASGLGPGEHVATIVADGGWGQWMMQGWSSRTARGAPDFGALAWLCAALTLVAAIVLARAAPRADLTGLARAIGDRIRTSQGIAAQAIAAGLALWATAGLSWAQDASTAYRNLGTPANVALSAGASALAFWAPVFLLSLAALTALFILIWLRLDIGLALAAFFAPFYLVPQRLFERAFSMVELITLMCVARWAVSLAMNAIRARRAGQNLPRFKPTLLDAGILGFVVVALFSSLQAEFRIEAFREWRLVVVHVADRGAQRRAPQRHRGGLCDRRHRHRRRRTVELCSRDPLRSRVRPSPHPERVRLGQQRRAVSRAGLGDGAGWGRLWPLGPPGCCPARRAHPARGLAAWRRARRRHPRLRADDGGAGADPIAGSDFVWPARRAGSDVFRGRRALALAGHGPAGRHRGWGRAAPQRRGGDAAAGHPLCDGAESQRRLGLHSGQPVAERLGDVARSSIARGRPG